MNKNLVFTALIGVSAIILGAFGAHSLKEILSESQLNSFETAVKYQMYHVIVLLVINMYTKFDLRTKNMISYLFFVGILLFSGSIYAISFGVNPKSIWYVTPLGGIFFILGWLKLAYSFYKDQNNDF